MEGFLEEAASKSYQEESQVICQTMRIFPAVEKEEAMSQGWKTTWCLWGIANSSFQHY